MLWKQKYNNRNFYRIQTYNSVMCGYVFIGFIDYKLKGKSLPVDTNLFELMIKRRMIK